ncbi:hypothetical protein Anas_05607 [Armadillidium nasatum]|uniref:Chitin-binding type-2 domain-containing protein n=1 Tax=Armadillidium nasatum TaxID=96803 RepID=A0A5N5SJS1_9CRUS|nr:hypothetical protein Anas_05607 [Armadillidium nasatum]
MFKKIIVCFVIPIIFAICLSVSSGDYGYGAYPIQLCSENNSFHGYCIDCETELDCNKGNNSTLHTCTQKQACQVSKTYAACTDISSVPDCSCPQGQTIKKADPYDDTKYLLCNNGERYIFDCPNNEIFDPETEACYTPPTTTSTTTTENPCSLDGGDVIKVNCTCYRYCLGGSSFLDECCQPGEIYDEVSQNCKFYYPFTCVGKTDGKYVDIHNCNEGIFATESCAENEEFDEDTEECSSDSASCDPIVDCGICPDDETFIKIDCYNYYDCDKNEDDSGFPPFVPNLDTCPIGSCFSAETGYCEI